MATIAASTGALLSEASCDAITAGHMHGIVERIARLEQELSDMTLMRDMLLSQLQSIGIDPVVRVTAQSQDA